MWIANFLRSVRTNSSKTGKGNMILLVWLDFLRRLSTLLGRNNSLLAKSICYNARGKKIKFPFKRKVLPSHPSCTHLRQWIKLSLNFPFLMCWDWLKGFQFLKSWKSWHYWTYCHFCLMVQASISLWLLKPFSNRSTYNVYIGIHVHICM